MAHRGRVKPTPAVAEAAEVEEGGLGEKQRKLSER